MAVIGLQSAIWSNRFKTSVLLVLFPALLFIVILLVEYFLWAYGTVTSDEENLYEIGSISNTAISNTIDIFTYLGPAILVWALISFYFQRQLIFAFSGARPIQRKDHPKIYNIVENLCISRGIATPSIGILDDASLNAFAVGWNPKRAWIVFSQGIIDTLDDAEIEAVAAHELTHILNKDGLLLATIIVYIGAIAALGEILVRSSRGSSSNNKKDGWHLVILGLALLLLGYLILPLVQLAISRKREFLADAGSVQLTKNKDAMKSALLKISWDSAIESIQKDSVSALCISNPFASSSNKLWFMSWFHDFFSTHPSIEDRVAMIDKY